ncbi:hypothetical protein K439DRAFT_1357420 [Ramaria rubella]|nr:hypothetical protein K439DRAFT_1357420 [Ramaria rubella]
MSLPPAPKDISDHPAKGSVTEPVNKTQLTADVDRKLHFYGVIQAFRAGKLPNNAQIDEILRYVADHSSVDLNKLSPAGKQLVNDTKDIIETARLIVKEKNADELFQNFIWHTRSVDYSPAKQDPEANAPISAEKAKADSQQVAHHLRTLLSLLLTNAETRKLLSDFTIVGRDLLARSADFIRPDEETLRRVDEPVAAHDPSGEKPSGETSSGLPHGEEEQIRSTKDDISAVKENVHAAKKDAVNSSTDGDGVPNSTHQEHSQATKRSLKDRFTDLKERVPQAHRDRVTNLSSHAKTFMAEEYFPKERRDRFISRGKKVILECQKDEDYQKSVKWLLDTLSEYGKHSTTTVMSSGSGAKRVLGDGTLREATNELRALLERFANGARMQPSLDATQRLAENARKDEGLRTWFGSVGKWVRKLLLEPGYILDEQCNREGVSVREEGRKYYDDKYKSQFDALFDAVGSWCSNLTNDPLNTRLGHDITRLTRDLLFDDDGSLTWKGGLWRDIRKVMLPMIVDKVGYIPIPRAEYTDDNLDLVIENLTLGGRNLFPNVVSVEAHNYAKFSPYAAIHEDARHELVITLGQMQADMRDVMFYFNKKTGMPKLTDSGLADILIGGSGITATIHLRTTTSSNTSSVFTIRAVYVKVGTLKFSIRDSKHDTLYNFLRPFAGRIVKRQVQRAMGDALRTALEEVDEQLVRVRERMRKEKESEDGEKEGKLGALKDLFKRQNDEAKKEKGNANGERSHSQFKVVAKRDSMLLPEMGNPHGWINRQQEIVDSAEQGPEWRSKA